MDKYEYKVRSEEISKLIDKEKYAEAVKIADTIDWRRVKSVTMLLRIAALYRVSRRNDDSREMLLLAYDRYPTNRSVVHSLCELSIEMEDVVSAVEYYKQFVKLAPKDSGVYTLRYRILEAQEVSLEERIEVLEELKKKDYQEEWAYELAYLYHRIGLATKCVEECDDIILWFGDGPYVMKAMELKAMHVPLTDIQQKNYDIMLGNAAENYSSENYDYGSNDANDKIVNFNPRNNNVENDTENYIENDIQDNYTAQDYGTDGYDENFSVQDFAGSGYENAAYGQEAYTENGYDQTAYNQTPYDPNGYDQTAYAQDGYGQDEYHDNNYDPKSTMRNSMQAITAMTKLHMAGMTALRSIPIMIMNKAGTTQTLIQKMLMHKANMPIPGMQAIAAMTRMHTVKNRIQTIKSMVKLHTAQSRIQAKVVPDKTNMAQSRMHTQTIRMDKRNTARNNIQRMAMDKQIIQMSTIQTTALTQTSM